MLIPPPRSPASPPAQEWQQKKYRPNQSVHFIQIDAVASTLNFCFANISAAIRPICLGAINTRKSDIEHFFNEVGRFAIGQTVIVVKLNTTGGLDDHLGHFLVICVLFNDFVDLFLGETYPCQVLNAIQRNQRIVVGDD